VSTDTTGSPVLAKALICLLILQAPRHRHAADRVTAPSQFLRDPTGGSARPAAGGFAARRSPWWSSAESV